MGKQSLMDIVWSYVDRHSGFDRGMGTIIDELRNIGIDAGVDKKDLESNGQEEPPETIQAAKEILRQKYRQELFKHVSICVITTYALLFDNKQNRKLGVDDCGVEVVQPRCGYKDPMNNLSDMFGKEDAISLVKGLDLRR